MTLVPNFDLTDAEEDYMVSRKANMVINAPYGIELHVYYMEGNTLVVAEGEPDNGCPWKFDGTVSAEDVLQQWHTSQTNC